MNQSNKYAEAGVSIAQGEELVERLKKKSKAIGGFAGIFPLDEHNALVACTDGIGTKIEIGIRAKNIKPLGQDLVAMSVNDLVVTGATPLFFLDYYATGKLDVDSAELFIDGINEALTQCQTVLLGGETAEMPGFYQDGHFDAAGFAVGKLAMKDLIDGSFIQKGDVIAALPSSGLHANGFSLVRKILADGLFSLADMAPGEDENWGQVLTRPTRLYVNEAKLARTQCTIKGMAHITGGGLSNIDRIIPKGLTKSIDFNAMRTPYYMKELAKISGMTHEEAHTVWNMGVGFVFIFNQSETQKMQALFADLFLIGSVCQPSSSINT